MLAGPGYEFGASLEEQFRTLGRIHALVKIAPAGASGFGHARAAAAVVGHARGPHALAFERREHFSGIELFGPLRANNKRHKISREIGMVHEVIPALYRDAIEKSLMLHVTHIRNSAVAVSGSVELHVCFSSRRTIRSTS